MDVTKLIQWTVIWDLHSNQICREQNPGFARRHSAELLMFTLASKSDGAAPWDRGQERPAQAGQGRASRGTPPPPLVMAHCPYEHPFPTMPSTAPTHTCLSPEQNKTPGHQAHQEPTHWGTRMLCKAVSWLGHRQLQETATQLLNSIRSIAIPPGDTYRLQQGISWEQAFSEQASSSYSKK